jgi:hypothetical protein
MTDLSESLTPAWIEQGDDHRSLRCWDEDQQVGYIDVGIAAAGATPAWVNVDMIDVKDEAQYRRGTVSTWLIDQVVAQWPKAILIGGPLGQDDEPGPSFRLRTWNRGIPFHEAMCEFYWRTAASADACGCLQRLKIKVEELHTK